jgi:hypothetical protein
MNAYPQSQNSLRRPRLRYLLLIFSGVLISLYVAAAPAQKAFSLGHNQLESFSAKVENERPVIHWQMLEQNDISHFVIERSTNGREFNEAGYVFSDDNSDRAAYNFRDDIELAAKGLIYYRLRITDMKGFSKYSAIKIIRLDEEKAISITAFPNPVVNELRVTIPSAWNNTQVNYDLYDSNGQLVKHLLINKAGQTETMHVSDIKSGIYTLRVSTADAFAVQKIFRP